MPLIEVVESIFEIFRFDISWKKIEYDIEFDDDLSNFMVNVDD